VVSLQFGLTAVNVLVMIAYAVPGFIFIKYKMVGQESTNTLAKILLYVCQPCLTVYSFNKADFTPELGKQMLEFFAFSTVLQLIMLSATYLVFRRKYASDASYRVCTVAGTLGNVGFLGVPLLEALVPNKNAVAFSAVFIIGMNFISWTVGSAIITGDKKYISVKKLIFNQVTLTLAIALPLFFTQTKLPSVLENGITVLGKMTTPISMLILGMRLALVEFKQLFTDKKVFFFIFMKLILFPLLGMAAVQFLPVDQYVKATLIILCCCPTASVVLSFAEMFNKGQKTAANLVLLSTLLSVITIPLMLMFVNA
jgi:predicted permease